MRSIFCILLLVAFSFSTQANLEVKEIKKSLLLEVNSSINPATLDYLNSASKRAEKESFDLIVLKLTTPGGLVTTTKDILTLFGRSEIPFVVWVGPEGASATSAGAILASGAHFLVMSEGTNIGAATPIQMSGDIKQKDARNKSINDLVALVQSLAETRKRNAKLFGEMIKSAASFKAKEALEKKLVDGIVNTNDELYSFLNKRTLHILGQDFKVNIPQKPIEVLHEMDSAQKLLNIFANPSLAYILFLIGAALIYLELQAPGGFIAGSLGAVCIILAGIGFQVLPLNFGGLGLIILSFILFILEAYVTSYGILSLAGICSLIFGSLFLYRTDNSYLSLSHSVIASSVGAILTFLGLIVFIMIKERKKIGATSFNSHVGQEAKIINVLESIDDGVHHYQVKVGGEVWKAVSAKKYEIGELCIVTAQKDIELSI